MFAPPCGDGYEEVLPGIQRKTLCWGERTLLCEFKLAGGSTLPAHAHPHEQIGYLVSGRLALTIGGSTQTVEPGGSWCIPPDTEHHAVCLAAAVAVEVFAPVRRDYLPEGA